MRVKSGVGLSEKQGGILRKVQLKRPRRKDGQRTIPEVRV